MEQNNIFSFSRFVGYIKRHYLLNYKSLIITLAAVAGFVAVIAALASFGQKNYNFQLFSNLYYTVMFIVGCILTSSVFSELHKPERAVYYLTLPVSNFEKLLANWLSTTIVYLFLGLITFYISYFMSNLLAYWWVESPMKVENIFQTNFLEVCKAYMVVHVIFFFGALYFKGYNFLKTILVLVALIVVYSFYQSMLNTLLFQDLILALVKGADINEAVIISPELEKFAENVLKPFLIWGFYLITPVYFLTLSYIRIKEREV